MPKNKNLLIIAFAAHGMGISGGDRIFIEFAKRWSKNLRVTVALWEEGYALVNRQDLKQNNKLQFAIVRMKIWNQFGFIVSYLLRVIHAVYWASTVSLSQVEYIYSASEFWMDCFPAFVIKIRNKKIRWIATWFQTAPNPLQGFAYGQREDRYRLKALIYWLVQLPSKFLINVRADFILVNNEAELGQFRDQTNRKVLVVLGAVDIQKISQWQRKNPMKIKKYQAVFQGRFHPQKGILELIDIWKEVVKKKPSSILALIGDGPLYAQVQDKIESYHLQRNIVLKGYLFDGHEKYQIFAQSKLVVHPAYYDSGGMASAEAMSFKLPIVGFDLPAFHSYYPVGMVTVKQGDIKGFAKRVISLLDNPSERIRLGKKGADYIIKHATWNNRSKSLYDQIFI